MPGGTGRYPGGVGGGTPVGVLRFGPDQNTFANNAARDTYAAANSSWLAEYDDDDSLVIQVGSALQRRVSGAWVQLDSTPPVLPNLATVAEANAGTETNLRMWSPLRVRQASRATVAARVPAVFQTGNTDRIPQAKSFGGGIVDFNSATRNGPAINLVWVRADGTTDSEAISARMLVEAFEALVLNQRLDVDSGTQGDLPLSRILGHTEHIALPPDVTLSEIQAGTGTAARLWSPAQVSTAIALDVANWAQADNTDLIPAGKLGNAPSTPGMGGGGLDSAAVNALIAAHAGLPNVHHTPTARRTAEQLRTAIGAPTTTNAGLAPSLPTSNAASHFYRGDNTWDEVDWSDLTGIPTIYSTPAALRSAIGGPTGTLPGLLPQLPAANLRPIRWMRADGTWAQVDFNTLLNRPTIPTLRDAAQTRTLLGLPAFTSGTARFLREDGTLAAVAYADITGAPTIPPALTQAAAITLIGAPTTTKAGLVPQLPAANQTTHFYRADGTWAIPPTGSTGGTGQTWPDATPTTLAADVQLPSTGADTYGAWTETYRLTNSAADEHKYLLNANLLCVASWWPGSSGADRGGADFRVRRMNSANVEQEVLIHELPVYIRTGSAAFDELSHYDAASFTLAFELQANDYLLVEGRGISQVGGTGRHILVDASQSNISYLDVTDVGGGGGGGSTGLTTVSRNATLTGDGTSGSPLGVTNPFTDANEARLNALTDAHIQELARDAVGTALTAGDGIDITPNDSANTITVAAEAASTTNAGIAELADAAEALTGTDGDKAVTPLALAGTRGTATPLADGTAAVGTAERSAREDHIHPLDPNAHSHSHTSTHTRYAAASTDTTFVAADFTASSTTDTITLPTFATNSYIAIAIPADEDDITFIRTEAGGLNQLGAFTKQATMITIGGAQYKWWRSNRRFLASNGSGSMLEFGS